MAKQNSLKLMGFTLIELLIVITIVGILIVGLVPRIVGAPAKARDAARLSDISQIATGLESYFSDIGSYPIGPIANNKANCIKATDTDLDSLYKKLVPTYMTGIPKDPQSGNKITTTMNSDLSAECTGEYVYEALFRTGTSNPGSGFYLLANTEIDKNGNAASGALNTVEVIADTVAACAVNACELYYLKR